MDPKEQNDFIKNEYQKFEVWLDQNKMNVDSFVKDERYAVYKNDAYFLRNLRNIVTHNDTDYFVIKEEGINRIKDFVYKITKDTLGKRMIPIEKLFTARMCDKVLPVLQELQRMNYSYLPIINEQNVCVKVFGSYVLMAYVSLGKSIDENTTFEDIYAELHGMELEETCKALSPESSIVKAINAFKKTPNFHLDMILVTKDGNRYSPLLGILTIWDDL